VLVFVAKPTLLLCIYKKMVCLCIYEKLVCLCIYEKMVCLCIYAVYTWLNGDKLRAVRIVLICACVLCYVSATMFPPVTCACPPRCNINHVSHLIYKGKVFSCYGFAALMFIDFDELCGSGLSMLTANVLTIL
jgi:hypothetical protein